MDDIRQKTLSMFAIERVKDAFIAAPKAVALEASRLRIRNRLYAL